MAGEVLLEVEGLAVARGGAVVVAEVGFRLAAGEVVALLGANGAGKSSVLGALIGLYPFAAGTARLGGRALPGGAARRAHAGLGYVPEGRRPFPGLTVRENLEVAAFAGGAERRRRLARVLDLFPQLARRAGQRGWQLSGGEAQMLAIGRALMGRPRVLLLDEPMLGLAPTVVDTVFLAVRRIADEGTAVLVAEQRGEPMLRLADRIVVLRRGRIVDQGDARDFDPQRLAVGYFGPGVEPGPASAVP